jgi:hypothetical protein
VQTVASSRCGPSVDAPATTEQLLRPRDYVRPSVPTGDRSGLSKVDDAGVTAIIHGVLLAEVDQLF